MKKILSAIISLCVACVGFLSVSVFASDGMLNNNIIPSQPGAYLLDGNIYVVNKNTIIDASGLSGIPGLRVAEGAKTAIYIPSGITLTVYGSNADKGIGGCAGINVPQGSELSVVGEGTLIAYGGNAGSGSVGEDGTAPSFDASNSNNFSGTGGVGGGGGGAGIGTAGGNGGNGGEQTKLVKYIKWDSTWSGDNGKNGENGTDSIMCGKVYISGVKTMIHGGKGGVPNSELSKNSTTRTYSWASPCSNHNTSEVYFIGGSGGGGTGGYGMAGANIGTGGGGGGGASGAIGGTTWSGSGVKYAPDGGRGGNGAPLDVNGEEGVGGTEKNVAPSEILSAAVYGGNGGTGGACGAKCVEVPLRTDAAKYLQYDVESELSNVLTDDISTIGFKTSCDPGYFAESKESEDRQYGVLFTATTSGYDGISNVKKYGFFLLKKDETGNIETSVDICGTDFKSFLDAKGVFSAQVCDARKSIIALPFLIVESGESVAGIPIFANVIKMEKWIGAK